MAFQLGQDDRRLLPAALRPGRVEIRRGPIVLLALLVCAPAGAWAQPAPAASDRDGDGVVDARDRCPDAAGTKSDGCPPRDTDGDRVTDDRDHCPGVPGPIENAGCPDSDEDGDGIVDRRDQCPKEYGPARLRGCREPDRDSDGIPDRTDRCPKRAERWNGRRDEDGCPDAGKALVRVANRQMRVVSMVRLARSGRLTPASRRSLAVLAGAIKRMGLGRVQLHVVAGYGLSYGDSIQQAQRLAAAARGELAKRTRLKPDAIEVVPHGPDGQPRVWVGYR